MESIIVSPIVLFIYLFLCICVNFSQQGSSYDTNRIVDERYPVIFSYINVASNFTHFGASVALSPGPQQGNPSSWIFIGAPTGRVSDNTNETGVLWRCGIGPPTDLKSSSEICKIINIDPTPGWGGRGEGSPFKEENTNMWTGGSLEISEGRLVTCGHRHTRGGRIFMNGICYFLQNKTTTTGRTGESSSYLDRNGPVIKNTPGYSYRLLPFFLKGDNNKKDQEFDLGDKGGEVGHEWAYGQVGTSIHIPKSGQNFEILLGAPGARMWSGAVVRYKDNPNVKSSAGLNFRLNRIPNDPTFSEYVVGHRGTQVQETGHWFELFGYSVTSGRYFDKSVTVYAGGSPRGADLSGDVVIFDLPEKKTDGSRLTPEEIYKRQINPLKIISLTSESESENESEAFGSYFGSVLYSVDVDGDGRDELFVGAPYFSLLKTRAKRGAGDGSVLKGEEFIGDNGCVFVYSFLETKEMNGPVHRIQSSDVPAPGGARFGSAISHMQWTNAADGKLKTYIVIGAPNEDKGQGAIYIFQYGDFGFQQVQKVLASEISEAQTMKGFGCSISLPQDVDLNGTPDFAVGAYAGSQAVVFRTRPQAFMKGTVTFKDKSRETQDGKILRTSTILTIESCITIYKVVGKILDMEISASLTLDKRLNVIQVYPWMTKQHDYSYFYTEKVSMEKTNDNKTCREFEVKVVQPKAKSKQYEIVQSIWYNMTRSGPGMKVAEGILEYKIQGYGNTTKYGKIELEDFHPNLPNAIQRITNIFRPEFAPNDCRSVTCNPSLHFKATWFSDLGKKHDLKPVSEILLEPTTDIIFELIISNTNETAVKPTLVIEWPRNGIEVNHRSERTLGTENCLLEKSKSQETSVMSYNCTFLEDITKLDPVVIQIALSFKNYYASQSSENFTINFSIKPGDANESINGNSLLALNADSKIVFAGSKKEDTLRSSIKVGSKSIEVGNKTGTKQAAMISWEQNYWIRVEGKSSVKVNLQLAFPHKRIGVGDMSSRPFIRINGRSNNNSYCRWDQEYFINSNANEVDPIVDVEYPDQGGSEIGGGIIPSTSTPSPVVPMVLTNGNENLGFPKNYKLLSDEALLIKCDNKDDNLKGRFSCLRVDCEINLLLGGSPVELTFVLKMTKDEIDVMLAEEEKSEVLVVSYGYASIFGDKLVVNDTSQTLFKPPFSSSVGTWVYIVSIIAGLLVLVVISYGLYKCGFFKRKEKEKLQLLKSETKQSVVLPNLKPGAETLEVVKEPL